MRLPLCPRGRPRYKRLEPAVVPCSVMVVGDRRTGKSTLLQQFGGLEIPQIPVKRGIGTSVATYKKPCGQIVHLTFYDINGDAVRKNLKAVQGINADVIILCLDIGRPESLHNACHKWYPWLREIWQVQPVLLIGCKSDLRNDIQTIAGLADRQQITVTYQHGVKTAKLLGAVVYLEVTSTCQSSMEELFEVTALTCCRALPKNHRALRRQSLSLSEDIWTPEGHIFSGFKIRKGSTSGCSVM